MAALLDAFTVQMIFRSSLPSGSQNPLDFISIEKNVVFARQKINDCLKNWSVLLIFLEVPVNFKRFEVNKPKTEHISNQYECSLPFKLLWLSRKSSIRRTTLVDVRCSAASENEQIPSCDDFAKLSLWPQLCRFAFFSSFVEISLSKQKWRPFGRSPMIELKVRCRRISELLGCRRSCLSEAFRCGINVRRSSLVF